MESNLKMDIKVGIFVAIGSLLLIFSIILLGGDRMFLRQNYALKLQLKSVQGLARGSVVSLSGMNIGNVGDIRFVPGEEKVELELVIDQEFQPRITKGSMAAVKTQGALGDKYVFIKPGPVNEPPLQDGDQITPDDEGDFLDVLVKKSQDLSNVVEVVNELHILLKNMNADNRSAKLMGNMVAASETLNKTLKDFQLIAQDVRGGQDQKSQLKKSMQHFSSVMEKIDSGEGSLGALINDRTLYEKLSGLVGGSQRTQGMKTIIRDSIQKSEKK